MKLIKQYYLCAIFICALGVAFAYNYLIILSTPSPSHYNVGFGLANGLAENGHQVTFISPFPLKKPVKNLLNITVQNVLTDLQDDIEKIFEKTKVHIMFQLYWFNDMGIKITKALLSNPSVQQIMNSNQTFDAVICEVFVNEAVLGLAEHFNAPLIGLSTFGSIGWLADLVGSPSPPSYVPHPWLKSSDHMSLIERIANQAFLTLEYINFNYVFLPEQEKLYNQFFPNNKQTLKETRHNTALVLLNQHVSISFPRPYSPNMIEVGGIHINRNINALPADIEQFINDAEHGVIYFSLGSNLKSTDLPLETQNHILNTLRGLKQHVLWKFENNDVMNKPVNVLIRDWFPQNDVLAHEKVLAFITHGGLLSTTEAIYHGKPLVGIPVFADQFFNMAIAEHKGYGVTVLLNELVTEKFKMAIDRIINESKYREKVQLMSGYYRDQKETPIERAIYWIEHVTRHKGAKYLRSASQDLNFIEYHNLDVILILYGGILVVLALGCLIARRIVSRVQEFFTQRVKRTAINNLKAKVKKQ